MTDEEKKAKQIADDKAAADKVEADKIEATKAEKLINDKVEARAAALVEEKLKGEIEKVTSSFESKLLAIKQEKEKDKQDFDKLVQDLESKKGNDDIIAEIKKSRKLEEEAAELANIRKEKEDAIASADSAIREKMEMADKLAALDKEKILDKEKYEFGVLLASEMVAKPWIAARIKDVLDDKNYETQKADYRFIKKFFDTPEVKSDFELRSTAGNSAFTNTIMSQGNGQPNQDAIVEKFIKEVQRKKKY